MHSPRKRSFTQPGPQASCMRSAADHQAGPLVSEVETDRTAAQQDATQPDTPPLRENTGQQGCPIVIWAFLLLGKIRNTAGRRMEWWKIRIFRWTDAGCCEWATLTRTTHQAALLRRTIQMRAAHPIQIWKLSWLRRSRST
jgi:hypothetical protein